MENPTKTLEKNPFVVKGIQNQAGNGIQNQAGNYTYNPRGNLGSLAENKIQQSDQFEINTDIGQVEKRRVRFNPNSEGHIIAFENVNEK